MTAPSIKEALELKPCPFCGCEDIKFNHPNKEKGWRGSINCPACLVTMPRECGDQELIDCWNERSALATFQPDGERREAIARISHKLAGCSFPLIVGPWHEEMASKIVDDLASGLVQNEAAIPDGYALVPIKPTSVMIEAGCENNPTQWNEGTDMGFSADVANDVYVAMVNTAIRSARDGGAET